MSNTVPTALQQFFMLQLKDPNGIVLPKRPIVQLLDGTLTDDPDNDQTLFSPSGGMFAGPWTAITGADSPYTWDAAAHWKIFADGSVGGSITMTIAAAPSDGAILQISTLGNVAINAPTGWQIFDPNTFTFAATANCSGGDMLLLQAVASSPAALALKLVPLSAF